VPPPLAGQLTRPSQPSLPRPQAQHFPSHPQA
jgi:hypothetical protein